MARHLLDVLDHKLERDEVCRLPIHAKASPSSLANLIEFASIRWHWFRDHHEDLLERLPHGDFDSECLPKLGAGLEVRVGNDPARGIHAVPALGSGWEPGTPFGFFQERFKTALVRAGLPSGFAAGLVGALVEMAGNASEHAESPTCPVAAFEITTARWEFCVSDVGIGMQGSLRKNPRYAALRTDVQALQEVSGSNIGDASENGRTADWYRREPQEVVPDGEEAYVFRAECRDCFGGGAGSPLE